MSQKYVYFGICVISIDSLNCYGTQSASEINVWQRSTEKRFCLFSTGLAAEMHSIITSILHGKAMRNSELIVDGYVQRMCPSRVHLVSSSL